MPVNLKDIVELVRFKKKISALIRQYEMGEKNSITDIERLFMETLEKFRDNLQSIERKNLAGEKITNYDIAIVFDTYLLYNEFILTQLNSTLIAEARINSANLIERYNSIFDKTPSFHRKAMETGLTSGREAYDTLSYIKSQLIELQLNKSKDSLQGLSSIGLPLSLSIQFEYLIKKVKDKKLQKELTREHKILMSEFYKIENKLGKKFFDLALHELEKSARNYSMEVTLDLENLNRKEYRVRFDVALDDRDTINALIKLLRHKRHLTEVVKQIISADKKIKLHAKELIENFDITNNPYYPKSFWWRHLEKI